MPTRYSIFLNESIQKQQKNLPICRSLKLEYIRRAISTAPFFVSWYRHRFYCYKLNSLSRLWHDIWIFKDEGIDIYPIWTKYTFFLPTLCRT